MKVGVLGAGAIGAFVGAAMARAGIDVTLVARGPHLQAMQRDGVRVLSPSGEYTVPVTATDDLDVLSDAEIVLVALKAYSLPAIAARLGGLLDPEACTIWAQNGLPWWYFHRYPGELEGTVIERVDPGGTIARSINLAGIIGCVVYCSTEIVEPGVIRHVEGTRFSLGELDGSKSERGQAISKLFVTAGLKAPLDANIRDQVWLKLIGNAAFNPITALTGATLGDLGKHEEVVEVLRAVLAECAEVAARLGVRFPVSLDRRLEAGIAVGPHKTSMLQDLEAGRPLELDCMTGAIVELADRLGIAVPHTRTVHACALLRDSLRASA
jgi:2-dehydropantoate 2-reductase